MTKLNTTKLLKVLKSKDFVRDEFLNTFASATTQRISLIEAKNISPNGVKIDCTIFQANLKIKDLELCEKIIAQALDEENARVQAHMINDFIAFYIDRTVTRERFIDRSKQFGTAIYEEYHYGDPEPELLAA